MIGRTRIPVVLLASVAALAALTPASAQRPLDLAGPQVVERPVTAGERITLHLINIVPSERSSYTIAIRQEVIPVDPLTSVVKDDKSALSADSCTTHLDETETRLLAATSEDSVRSIVLGARRGAPEGCGQDLNTMINNLTTFALDDAFILRPSQRLVVEVTRGEKKWSFVFRTEPRGEWRTGYGFTFVPRVYPQYRTEQLEDDPTNFVIQRERGNRRSDPMTNYDFLPSILFTWMPQEARYRNWNGGITAGLGYDLSSVAVFGGLSVTHNENVTFAGGLAIHQQPRLAPGFEPGDVVGDPLSSEALHEPRFGPNLFFGISFRFGKNPFGNLRDDTDAEEDVVTEERPEPQTPEVPTEEREEAEVIEDDAALEVKAASDAGASFGSFTLKSIDADSDPRILVLDAAAEPVEVSGTYDPRDGVHCIALDAESKAMLPWFHARPEVLCLTVPDAKKDQVEAVEAQGEITVTITGFRIRHVPGQPTAIYDEGAVADVITDSDGT